MNTPNEKSKECKCCEDIHWGQKCMGTHGHLVTCKIEKTQDTAEDTMGEFTPKYHQDQLHKIGYGDTAEKECEHHWRIVSEWGISVKMMRRECEFCKKRQDAEYPYLDWKDSPIYQTSVSSQESEWKKCCEDFFKLRGESAGELERKQIEFLKVIHASALAKGKAENISEVNIGMLRQWLNEEKK